jgi:hypothetical protein
MPALGTDAYFAALRELLEVSASPSGAMTEAAFDRYAAEHRSRLAERAAAAAAAANRKGFTWEQSDANCSDAVRQ